MVMASLIMATMAIVGVVEVGVMEVLMEEEEAGLHIQGNRKVIILKFLVQ